MTRLLQVWLGIRLYVMCNALYDYISDSITWRAYGKLPFITVGVYIACAIDIIGMAILFEKHKKTGFYLMCAACIGTFVIALCVGASPVNALWPIAITYMLMVKRWNEFS
ncbi:MAG: hypothetical protein HFI20_05060 [Lachnospiraceae bacterium]|nr:hypothetical protein [Lachnospiraceae bacterium]